MDKQINDIIYTDVIALDIIFTIIFCKVVCSIGMLTDFKGSARIYLSKINERYFYTCEYYVISK